MLSEQYQITYDMFKNAIFKKIFASEEEQFVKGVQENFRGGDIKPGKQYTDRYEIDKFQVEGCNCFHYINKKAERAIIYLHGGGFFIDIDEVHWAYAGELLEKTNAEVYIPQYPITPESNCEPTYKMLLTLYQEIRRNTQPEDIVIMGDSAGGGIALSFAMLLREKQLPQPKEIILISPCLKLMKVTEEEKEMADQLDQLDPMLSYKCMETIRRMWGGERQKEDYIVNPFYGDIKGLGRITMFSGTWDILYLYNKEFYEKVKEEGSIVFYVRDQMIHDYVILPVEEAKQDRKIIVDTILRK